MIEASGFADVAARLRAAPPVMRREIRKAMTVTTRPARQAVKQELLDVMPKSGGLNTFLASASIRSQVLTGARTAGVVVRARLRGHDLAAANRGYVRHPLYGNRDHWFTTQVPAGWWESTLQRFGPDIRTELVAVMAETARVAGFDGRAVVVGTFTLPSVGGGGLLQALLSGEGEAEASEADVLEGIVVDAAEVGGEAAAV